MEWKHMKDFLEEERTPKKDAVQLMVCPKCGHYAFIRVVNLAHGIPGAIMEDSERYKCKACKHEFKS